ncbi:MAG: hypothetical protein ACYC0F_06200 [Rhodanobacter sp.]
MSISRSLPWLAAAVLPGIACGASWPRPALPDGTRTADVARRIVFNGLDMRAQVFATPRSPAEVVAFYEDLWKGEVVVDQTGKGQVIGHRQGDYYITVQVSGNGGGSRGDIGIVDVASAPKHFEPGKGLPHPMGSTVFNDIAYPDDPTPARTVAMRNRLSPQQNASYFRERLGAEGWKPADANPCDAGSCVLRYERGDSRMTLVMSALGGQSQVTINVLDP